MTTPRPFAEALDTSGLWPLRATGIEVLQLNLGKLCNQTCKHCHVDAGPTRTEVMSAETVDACLRVLRASAIPTLDLTGGAPEMNPHFRRIVVEARGLGRRVIDRCNLTILTVGSYRDFPEFLAEHEVEVVASLPYFLARGTDSQRGDGVFESSIAAIRRLNALGYGVEGSGLTLNLAYNPVGAFLPPSQAAVEPDFRRELLARHGVIFNNLYVIANMPIGRFRDFLHRSGQLDEYMGRLAGAYNPAAAAGVMCRSTLSVGWDGRLYDCDFNQMLEIGLGPGLPGRIAEFEGSQIAARRIEVGPHCYGCTAGAGSGCGGAVVR